MRLIAAALAASLLACAGCAHEVGVERVVDGRLLVGRFIEPEAYAAFLRGAVEEERGNLPEALRAYHAALEVDSAEPEIWSRVARVRCALKAPEDQWKVALRRAFALDPEYAGAWAALAQCELASGHADAARDAASKAAAQDPAAVDLQVLLLRASAAAGPSGDGARARLVSLTLAHATSVAAWDALAAWARDHGDLALYARALVALAQLDARRSGAIAEIAEKLAGEGEVATARELARAVSDAGARRGFGGPTEASRPLAARLALDEAIERGDVDRVRLRATRTHLGLERAAARALLAGHADLARRIAEPLAEADPQAACARIVLASSADGADAVARSPVGSERSRAALPVECALAFARRLAQTMPADDVARVYAALDRDRIVLGDGVVLPVAVDLAAQGILPAQDLPLDGAVELAARRGEAPPDAALHGTEAHPAPVDARHELLALAIAAPHSPRARELATRLARLRDRDPLVAVGLARLDLAAPGAAGPSESASALLGRDPSDPLVAATALDVARKRGDTATLTRARAVLSALARTGAERARLTE